MMMLMLLCLPMIYNVIPSDDCSSPTLSHDISLSSLPSPPIAHSAISLEKVTSFYEDDLVYSAY